MPVGSDGSLDAAPTVGWWSNQVELQMPKGWRAVRAVRADGSKLSRRQAAARPLGDEPAVGEWVRRRRRRRRRRKYSCLNSPSSDLSALSARVGVAAAFHAARTCRMQTDGDVGACAERPRNREGAVR
ncbi:unnamed protein product [Prorocentrum cordatum]|uniref:Uncharacterized protein n=1 Tax=Prorocentrum cordatum TaxID=2364126 RepID=A0ABN9VMU4_9DINO|nr:unnamed protein product [Polarella glacialis]